MEWTRNGFNISADKSRLSLDVIHAFLKTTYWAADRSREQIARSLESSLCFGLYHDMRQIGFARVVTDEVSHSWLGDVFVLPEFQGQGLGKWLVACVVSHPIIKVTGCDLGTRDAHGLYEKFGFTRREQMNLPPE